MLYHFKSKVGDLTMLEPNGRQVLEIIGKDTSAKGIITPDQMPAAIAALEAAVSEDKAASPTPPLPETEEEKKNEPVMLRARAVPFIDLLQRAQAKGAEVTWGV